MNNNMVGKSLDELIKDDKGKKKQQTGKNPKAQANGPQQQNKPKSQATSQRLNKVRQNLQQKKAGKKLVVSGKNSQNMQQAKQVQGRQGVYRKQAIAKNAAQNSKNQNKNQNQQPKKQVPQLKKGPNRIQKPQQAASRKSVSFARNLSNPEKNTQRVQTQRRQQLLKQRLQQTNLSGKVINQIKKKNQASNQQSQGQQQQAQAERQTVKAFTTLEGSLEQRKIKVRNIDAGTVTVQDLHRLFGRCGPVIIASFDKNMFGQYLGSATVVFAQASAASYAIKNYNGAQLDDRVMKIEYAPISMKQGGGAALGNVNSNSTIKKGPNAIQKTNNQQRKQNTLGGGMPQRAGGQQKQNVVRGRGGKTLVINKQGGGRGGSQMGSQGSAQKQQSKQQNQGQGQNSARQRLEIRKQKQNQPSRGGNRGGMSRGNQQMSRGARRGNRGMGQNTR